MFEIPDIYEATQMLGQITQQFESSSYQNELLNQIKEYNLQELNKSKKDIQQFKKTFGQLQRYGTKHIKQLDVYLKAINKQIKPNTSNYKVKEKKVKYPKYILDDSFFLIFFFFVFLDDNIYLSV